MSSDYAGRAATPFTHSDETAKPDYYCVSLTTGRATRRIRAEMTATERCAYLRFTFPTGSRACSSRPRGRACRALPPSITAAREIIGYNPDRMDACLGPLKLPNFKGYFVVQFRQRSEQSGTYGLGRRMRHEHVERMPNFDRRRN